jgi:hypothetical protein
MFFRSAFNQDIDPDANVTNMSYVRLHQNNKDIEIGCKASDKYEFYVLLGI